MWVEVKLLPNGDAWEEAPRCHDHLTATQLFDALWSSSRNTVAAKEQRDCKGSLFSLCSLRSFVAIVLSDLL
jgi:hypothetical protein